MWSPFDATRSGRGCVLVCVTFQEIIVPFSTPTPSILNATHSALVVHEGLYAVAAYGFDRPLPGSARFAVTLTGWDASPGTDTGAMELSTDAGATWTALVSGVPFSLDSGSLGFQVRVPVLSDGVAEAAERFVFTASQAEYSPYVSNSWWVQTLVQIADGAAAVPFPTGAASATLSAAQAVASAAEGQAAQATFNLSTPLARDVQVHVGVTGWGANLGSDFQGLDYRMIGASAWSAVPVDGRITLSAGAAGFELRTQLQADGVSPEAGESVVFVASQTAAGQGLQDSWWVQSQVTIQDVSPAAGPSGSARWVLPGFDIDHGWELWTSDGTAAGSALLVDVQAGMTGAGVSQVTALGQGQAVFSANDGVHGTELWVTDGTAAGTALVQDILAGASGSTPQFITAVGNGRALFQAVDLVHGYELWVTDGTAAGTQVLKDIQPGTASGGAWGITALGNGRVIFGADDGVNGAELWVSDGTAAGTQMLKDINPGAGSGNLFFPTTLGNGMAVFNSYDADHGFELWVTDGTAGGTTRLMDIAPGNPSGNPFYITALGNGRAVFMANDLSVGQELWITDGTAGGTVLLKDIVAGTAPSSPSDITPLGNGLAVFRAEDGVHGRELWVTDGTAAGTHLVKDIVPGLASTDPITFTALGHGLASFYCDDGIGRPMLYVTDGTEAGTHRLHDWGVLTGTVYHDYLNWAQAAALESAAPVTGADTARLSAAQATLAVTEGEYAVARFDLSATLAADAQVDVFLHGWSALVGTDTAGFDFSTNGTDWSPVPASARVTIAAGSSGVWLRAATTADNLTESAESLVFVVQQASSNLTDSWWLHTTVTLTDPSPNTVTGGAGADALAGTAAQDVFVIPSGSSIGLAGAFDTISGLGLGDRIDLPSGVNTYNLVTLTPAVSDEAGLLAGWSFIDGWTFPGGAGAVLKMVLGADAYLAADTNGNGMVDSGGAVAPDLFIKIVGGAGLTADGLM